MPSLKKMVVVLVGATAVGKTDLAVRLAGKYSGEIISADSRLFYRGMDCGTAKPTKAEQNAVPHHLIDISEPDETRSLAVFLEQARVSISDVLARGKTPFVVGGTGQFIWGIVEGWQVPAQEPRSGMRTALEDWSSEIGKDGLHQRLAVLDPQAARNIQATNLRRVIRALEVTLSIGRKFSEQQLKVDPAQQFLIIGLKRSREELYKRIDERIGRMFAVGLVDEVKKLLSKGFDSKLPSFSAIGYRETAAFLTGRLTFEETIRLMKRFTRQFVRRQSNWFSDTDERIHWFEMDETIEDRLHQFISERLPETQKG